MLRPPFVGDVRGLTTMAIKFQYNKTSLQQLEKNLKMRQRTLPIIKSKETALRLEVKKCKEEVTRLEQDTSACTPCGVSLTPRW